MAGLEDAVRQIQNPSSSSELLGALQHLKNESIGRLEQKDALVKIGLLDGLHSVLVATTRNSGKKRSREGDLADRVLSEEDEIRHQAVTLCSSIAHGGPEFAAPIVSSNIVPRILESCSPDDSPPKLVTTSLLALSTIAAATEATASLGNTNLQDAFAEQIYSPFGIQVLSSLLSMTQTSTVALNQVSLACQLLHKSLLTEQHRDALISASVLDLLGARLAASYVAQGFWSPRAVRSVRASLPPAPTRQQVGHVFAAINTVIGKSRYRCSRLLLSPVVASVMPLNSPDTASEAILQYANLQSGATRKAYYNLVDAHLPQLPSNGSAAKDAFSKQFPALGTIQSNAKYSALMDFAESVSHTPDRNGVSSTSESTVIPWLFYMVRLEQGYSRLQAAKLLTIIAHAGLLNKVRERQLAFLVVPLLVEMLSAESSAQDKFASTVQEQAPKVLAELIHSSPSLQKAAVDAGVQERVIVSLKRTFIDLPARPLAWSVESADTEMTDALSLSRTVGKRVLRPDVQHVMRCREACLVLVASICSSENKFRTTMNELGVVSLIIDSLTPTSPDSEEILAGSARIDKLNSELGNTLPVILAACSAARSMSRSIALLRTSLIDNGLVAPVFSLLSHPNSNVIVSASDVICNLIMECSPMREHLVKFGAIKALSEHAHSGDSQVRLVSLWGLKHLVYKALDDVRLACYEEVGPEWLMQMISSGRPLSPSPTFTGTDLCTPRDGRPEIGETLIPAGYSHIPELIPLSSQHLPRLRDIKRREEAMPARQQAADEVSIQVQGLDFLRNLLLRPGDMVDKIFEKAGPSQIYNMIEHKLRPLSVSDASMAGLGSTIMWLQPPEVLSSTLYILVHIAAGPPRYREQIASRRELLSSLLTLLTSHPDPMVRLPAIFTVLNLIWIDCEDDRTRVKDVCSVLRAMGFADALDRLRGDSVQDVRDRATAAYRSLLSGESGVRGPVAAGLLNNPGPSAPGSGGVLTGGSAVASPTAVSGSMFGGGSVSSRR